MTLTQLNYIITIAETKSINKAAELLYVSQPSLTSAVRELEKELKPDINAAAPAASSASAPAA